jgi:hypothetical protein
VFSINSINVHCRGQSSRDLYQNITVKKYRLAGNLLSKVSYSWPASMLMSINAENDEAAETSFEILQSKRTDQQ